MGVIKFFLLLLVIIMAFFSIVRKSIKSNQKEEESRNYYRDTTKELKFILKLKPIVYGIYIGIVAISLLFGSIYFTNEQEIGFTSFFGHNTMIEGPGMHFKIPFLSQKHVYDSTTKGMPVGYVEGTDESNAEDSLMITSDFNFINIDFYIEYRIVDPIEYCYGSDDPEGVLKNIAQASIRNTVGQYNVDAVLTTGKSEIETKVYEEIIERIEEHHIGISVGNVTIQDSEPPTSEVNDAFKAVEPAKQGAETTINNARKYANEQIPAAEAKAEEVKQAATATKTERTNAAKEEVAKFEALFKEYQRNPETVKRRLYYEALQEILPNMEVIIGKDAKVIYIKDGVNIQTNETSSKKNTVTVPDMGQDQ